MIAKLRTEAPSNIALVKYWGKKGTQHPLNPSLSMTLKNAKTEMSLQFKKREDNHSIVDVIFEGASNHDFRASLEKRFSRVENEYPGLKDFSFFVETKNTFPHSSGIASSASSMASFALAIAKFLESHLNYNEQNLASKIARLLSGSACRSIYGGFVSWGEQSNDYASEIKNIHPEMKNLKDAIIIVSRDVKDVSSSSGHSFMENHPFREGRIVQAKRNFGNLCLALNTNDFETFCQIVEEEALTLHALMLTSNPPFCLLKPKTLEVIEKIKKFKNEKNILCTYTIDAGPNIHLIYKNDDERIVKEFLSDLGLEVLFDELGLGATFL